MDIRTAEGQKRTSGKGMRSYKDGILVYGHVVRKYNSI